MNSELQKKVQEREARKCESRLNPSEPLQKWVKREYVLARSELLRPTFPPFRGGGIIFRPTVSIEVYSKVILSEYFPAKHFPVLSE